MQGPITEVFHKKKKNINTPFCSYHSWYRNTFPAPPPPSTDKNDDIYLFLLIHTYTMKGGGG